MQSTFALHLRWSVRTDANLSHGLSALHSEHHRGTSRSTVSAWPSPIICPLNGLPASVLVPSSPHAAARGVFRNAKPDLVTPLKETLKSPHLGKSHSPYSNRCGPTGPLCPLTSLTSSPTIWSTHSGQTVLLKVPRHPRQDLASGRLHLLLPLPRTYSPPHRAPNPTALPPLLRCF